MLVRFLSFVVSLIGTGRYKTVLLSCLALILSLTSFTYLIVHGSSNTAQDKASTAVQQQKDTIGEQSPTPQLGNTRKQETKQVAPSQTADNNTSTANTSSPSSSPSTTSTKPVANFDFTLSTNSLTMAADSTSDPITASTSDGTAVSWQATVDDSSARVIMAQNNSGTTSFQIQATKGLASGKTFVVTLTAQGANRNINLSKTITVTIQ